MQQLRHEERTQDLNNYFVGEECYVRTSRSPLQLLLRQIVDEENILNSNEQEDLLGHIRLEKLVSKFKALDKQLENNTITLTEDEIADLLSKDREKSYEEKVWGLSISY